MTNYRGGRGRGGKRWTPYGQRPQSRPQGGGGGEGGGGGVGRGSTSEIVVGYQGGGGGVGTAHDGAPVTTSGGGRGGAGYGSVPGLSDGGRQGNMNWQVQNAEQAGYNPAFGNPPFQQGSNPAYGYPPERRGSNQAIGYPAGRPGYGQQSQYQTANNAGAHQQGQGQGHNHQFGQHSGPTNNRNVPARGGSARMEPKNMLGRVETSKFKPACLPGDRKALDWNQLVEGVQGSNSASTESRAGERGRNGTAARLPESKYWPPRSAEDKVPLNLRELRKTVDPSVLSLNGRGVEGRRRSRASGFASRSRTTSLRDPSEGRVESLVEAEDESGDLEISASAFKEVR